MVFGPATGDTGPSGRILEPAEWAAAGIPLLRNPREIVTGLHARHRPPPQTAVVAVVGPDERLLASASLARREAGRPEAAADGWDLRNALLARLRRVIPHDLRRRFPVRTAVLLYCRAGDAGWTEEDGAWMWGLRDACTLHGLRCGAYITLTGGGWQVLGEGRGGRRPYADGPAADAEIAADVPAAQIGTDPGPRALQPPEAAPRQADGEPGVSWAV
ncbi:hypothetical protein O7599_08955 [Streptomyces sp. WMMC500]|uniref:hypothetical protein n=1 Tax=Streptomyces sp. WMMC500 TaxID=3015154 RepID=UPI00248C8E86|nr:hypothetical protein [Streptomyces sp. WMMC500]WBB62641.1 hypothetical protein O7599_08955 [Streptomyces sp. WMMC500]